MTEILTQIVQSEITWVIVGLIVKSVCPAAIPFLGAGRKLANELAEMHDKSKDDNKMIIQNSYGAGLRKAGKFLDKKLEK
jgi:hypothetical protein